MSAAAFLAALALSCVATWRLIPWLCDRGMVDRPNERSSHRVPTPRGGGLAPVGVAVGAWIALAVACACPAVGIVAGGAVLLAAVGWLDDRRSLPLLPRLAGQIVAVALGLAALPEGLVAQGLLPEPLDRAFAALAWLWFVNLTNFMDGVDGLAAGNAAVVAAGIAAIALAGSGPAALAPFALALAGAALGFLAWNRPPAKVFLGDAGSVPLGFLLGWLLLILAAKGAWAAALILPLYFLGDATATLMVRTARGEAFWRAHREHAYQVAVRNGRGHAWVTSRILALDLWLVALAAFSLAGGWAAWLALGAAVVSVGGTLWYFRRAPSHGR
jgi:UDP-N-acetylmuramyl pentapeptide phosphotransferase/UDP-N-acetylglucosamine-1-phosphate transferase